MAQHDYVVDNGAGGTVRADLNAALLAIVSGNAGDTAPATTYANMGWIDTANDKQYLRNKANTAWIEVLPDITAAYGGVVSAALAPVVQAATLAAAFDLFGYSNMLSPGGRCTLTSATPVTTSDVTAAATIYYAFDHHNFVPLWDGTRWTVATYTELSLALDSDSGHTGYHQSGKNFDLFLYNHSGTLRLASGPAWTSDTARADAIARKNGRWTNNASIVLRYGSASGETVTAAANTALYVGSFRATANGQTEDSKAKRFLFNAYNRRRRPMRVNETTNSWTYTTAAHRQANGSAANQLDFLIGLAEDAVTAQVRARAQNDNANVEWYTSIGFDAVNAIAADCAYARALSHGANQPVMMSADWKGYPGLGRHFLAWLEYSVAVGTTTWYGDNGGTPPIGCITGEVWA